MKKDFNCEIARTVENEWFILFGEEQWQCTTAVEIQKCILGNLTEILAECEKKHITGTMFVDIHFQQYKLKNF